MKTYRQILTEAKKFKSSYKEGDLIKVNAVRRPVYNEPGRSAPSEKETKKTLEIVQKASQGKNAYVVKIKGMKVKIPQTGGSRAAIARLSIVEPDFGVLTTSSPRPGKWEVTPA